MKYFLKSSVSIIMLILLFSIQAQGQFNNHLILKKGPRNKMHFLAGDSIILMKNHFKTPVREQIQGIGENFIIIKNEEVQLKEISGIVKYRALHYRAAGAALKVAGPGLILLDGINTLISKKEGVPLVGRNVLITGASMFAAGFLLPKLQIKVYYMDRGYYLRIVPADPGSTTGNMDIIRLP